MRRFHSVSLARPANKLGARELCRPSSLLQITLTHTLNISLPGYSVALLARWYVNRSLLTSWYPLICTVGGTELSRHPDLARCTYLYTFDNASHFTRRATTVASELVVALAMQSHHGTMILSFITLHCSKFSYKEITRLTPCDRQSGRRRESCRKVSLYSPACAGRSVQTNAFWLSQTETDMLSLARECMNDSRSQEIPPILKQDYRPDEACEGRKIRSSKGD